MKEVVCVRDVLEALQPLPGISPTCLTVSRSSIFADSVAHFKQRNFDFKKPLKVTTEGKAEIDSGGLNENFLPLFWVSFYHPQLLHAFLKEEIIFFLQCMIQMRSDLIFAL